MKRSLIVLAVSSLSLFACGGKEEVKAPETPAPSASVTAEPAPSASAAPVASAAPKEEPKPEPVKKKTVLDVAKEAGNFTTLLKLVGDAGLTDTLSGDGPFTVFAPTDDAFKKVSAKDLEALGKDKERLTAVLKYHVVAGKVLAADVVKMKTAKTVEGTEAKITVSKDGKTVTLDKAKVVKTDIAADNGVIHVLDTVIMPPVKKAATPAKPATPAAPAKK